VRDALYDANARRRTVSMTLNADLCAKARHAGINLSRVAEDAIASALSRHVAERLRDEIKQDLEAHDAFVEQHGSFAAMVREHYGSVDGDGSI
jgi:antitoxin CcdA